jgi:oligopeptide transport system ATP-binding protein
MPDTPLLDIKGLRVGFDTETGPVVAVDGIDLTLAPGRTLGLVGESGCGKSVTAFSIMRLLPQPHGTILSGQILFNGRDLAAAPLPSLCSLRGREISMIFQEPMTALNPVQTIGRQLAEAVTLHDSVPTAEVRRRCVEMLTRVRIPAPEARMNEYPHQLSGGMRQRIMIAMALINKPKLLIADEPTTALDVTVQAQILELIKKMQRELGMAVVFITHDLGVVSGLCDRVQVMYAGRIVETADTRTLFHAPRHPYTRALQRSIPALQSKGAELYTIPGLPPDVSKTIPGCAFAPRCEFASARCTGGIPELTAFSTTHSHACLRVQAGEI